MKCISLTQNKFAVLDDDDYENALRFTWHYKPSLHTGYARTTGHLGYIGGRRIKCQMYLHRLIMRPPYGMQIDHINQNGLDCRRSNMRLSTKSQNQYNKRSHNGFSQYKGVSWDKEAAKWRADINKNGKHHFIGRYSTETDAALAYDEAARNLAGEYACTNFDFRHGGPVVPSHTEK